MPLCPTCGGYCITLPCPVCEQQSEKPDSFLTEQLKTPTTIEENILSDTVKHEDRIVFPESSEIPLIQYDVTLHLSGDTITAKDSTTNEVLKIRKAPKNLIVEKIDQRNYYSLSLHGKNQDIYELHVRALELDDSISTEAGYIFSIQYEPELSLGAFFGYYAWGLFYLEDNKIKIIFSREVDELITGIFTKYNGQLLVILGFSDGTTEAIELHTESDIVGLTEKGQLWKTEDISGITGIALIDDNLISCHKNGHVRIRELKKGRLLRDVPISNEGIRSFVSSEKFWHVGTNNGNAIALNPLTWRVVWQTNLSNRAIMGVDLLSNQLCFVDNDVGIYWVSPDTGKIQKSIKSRKGVASKPVQLKKWLIVAGAAVMMVFEGENCFETYAIGDNLIRALCPHSNGVLAGNDSGQLSLWSHPGLKIIKV